MPSDFAEAERISKDLVVLGTQERSLLEGAIFDTMSNIRTDVRLIDALVGDARYNISGQTARTRSKAIIESATLQRDINVDLYTTFRKLLLNLGHPTDDPLLPQMTPDAWIRKGPTVKRALGDTYRPDGLAWTAGAITADQRQTFRPFITQQAANEHEIVSTQSHQRPKRTYSVKTHSIWLPWALTCLHGR
jgi:hypothetical protein